MTRIRKTTATIALGAALLGGSAAAVIATTVVGTSGVSAATAIEYGVSAKATAAPVGVSNPTAVEYGGPSADASGLEYAL
jgi:hypothetical protein